jgi:hypothetical protein
MVLCSAIGLRSQETSFAGGQPPDWMTAMGFATNVPEAVDFVRRTRPAPESLDYRSPYATDVARPRPRSTAEVEALARDLETAAARSRARAAAGPPIAAAPPPRSPAPR